jgi:hypothetical protein
MLNVTHYDTVKKVKWKTALEDSWYEAKDQCLIFEGRELKDGLTLGDYNILNNQIIYLLVRLGASVPWDRGGDARPDDWIEILINITDRNELFPIKVTKVDSVLTLKLRIQDMRSLPIAQLRLFFNGRKLVDHNQSLQDLGIQAGSMVIKG